MKVSLSLFMVKDLPHGFFLSLCFIVCLKIFALDLDIGRSVVFVTEVDPTNYIALVNAVASFSGTFAFFLSTKLNQVPVVFDITFHPSDGICL